jgi:hypothetical protein
MRGNPSKVWPRRPVLRSIDPWANFCIVMFFKEIWIKMGDWEMGCLMHLHGEESELVLHDETNSLFYVCFLWCIQSKGAACFRIALYYSEQSYIIRYI